MKTFKKVHFTTAGNTFTKYMLHVEFIKNIRKSGEKKNIRKSGKKLYKKITWFESFISICRRVEVPSGKQNRCLA